MNPVKLACETQAITQNALAYVLATTPRTVSRWATGETPIPLWAGWILAVLAVDKPADLLRKRVDAARTLFPDGRGRRA